MVEHMTRWSTYCCVACLVAVAGCSSSTPERRSDEFFEPVRVTQVTREPEGTPVPEFSSPADVPAGAEPMLRQMMREQNRRMADLERRIQTMETKQEIAQVENERRQELTAGEETLLALIRQQNMRLEEIIEQVRLMAERREGPEPVVRRSPARTPKVSSRGIVGRAQYATAVAAYRRGQYREAEILFATTLQGPVAASLADNCRFWIGVCRFQRRDLVGARAALDPVSRDMSSDKRTAAILMLGQVYEGLGRFDLARATFQEIIRDHPQSSLRTVAEQKLSATRSPR